MANKLRNLFDEEKQELTGKVSFQDIEKYNNFVAAIEKTTKEGIPTAVDGISGISISFKDGNSQYPLESNDNVTNVVIYPCESPVNIDVETDKGKRTLRFLKKQLENKTVLETIDKKGADIKIVYDLKEKRVTINYNAKYIESSCLDELVDYFNTLYFFSKKMFRTEMESEEVESILNYFLVNVIYLEQLQELSKKLEIQILPSAIKDIEDDDLFVERLFFSLVENKVLRSNRKVMSMNNISFVGDKRPGDNPMIVTYLEQGKVSLCGKEVNVFFVNMAFNIVVDKEEILENGDSKLFFKDMENDPMYISSKILLSEEEAKKELEDALDNKEPYVAAKTLGECIRDRYDNYRTSKVV